MYSRSAIYALRRGRRAQKVHQIGRAFEPIGAVRRRRRPEYKRRAESVSRDRRDRDPRAYGGL